MFRAKTPGKGWGGEVVAGAFVTGALLAAALLGGSGGGAPAAGTAAGRWASAYDAAFKPGTTWFDEAALRKDIEKIVEEKNCGPIFVRLGWHDAGTYSKWDNTGGPTGSIRFSPEATHGANAGLKWAVDTLEPLFDKYSGVSHADLYQLASVVSVELAGGPKVPFRRGRRDAVEPAACTPDGRLPDATKKQDHLRDIFYRMGFNDQEIVALSGAHTLGRAHKDRSGFDGPWTSEPLKFNNEYFRNLVEGDKSGFLVLTSDRVLMEDPAFKPHVERYAEDEAAFFEDYAKAHKKLSELGVDFPM